MTLRASILGVSVWGPGLEGWGASRPVLAGQTEYQPRPSPAPPPAWLSATERRRTGAVVRLALAVAHEAAQSSGLPPGSLRSVFASSNGDGPVVGGILDALSRATDERVVSPTQFHNSVHNAASGYWSIATASRQSATCIGCYDDSWSAGLLAALAELRASGAPVLLCCYDHPMPAPLDVVRATGPAFAAALVLGPEAVSPYVQVAYDPEAASGSVMLEDPGLQELARVNPAARALPLLCGLARGAASRHALPYLEGSLTVEVRP